MSMESLIYGENKMKSNANLTSREREVTELIAWGATKKEIANKLFISEETVKNHTRNIFEKTGCNKSNELSAWYFCTTFHISFNLSPITRQCFAIFLLSLFCFNEIIHSSDTFTRVRRTKIRTEVINRRCRARRDEFIYTNLAQ